MKIYSFAYYHQKFIPIEISVTLVRGVSNVQFTGTVDGALKDAIPRIKSAIRQSGFKWPKTQQILIHIRPEHFKIVSFGLDLALAAAILRETGQIPDRDGDFYFYANLGLNGQVFPAEGLGRLDPVENLVCAVMPEGLPIPSFGIDHLQALNHESLEANKIYESKSTRPSLPKRRFSKVAAEALSVLAIGRHSSLFVGPSGSGKTTLADSLYYLQSDLDLPRDGWRPMIRPHHSLPVKSFIGGGYPISEGELPRAHEGLLLLDEYLEFHPHIQESLRQPLEQGYIEVARRGQKEKFPCQFQFVATSNLCACGDLTPRGGIVCGRPLYRCRSVLDRLSGPVLDRFDGLYFSDLWQGERAITLEEILQRLEDVRSWRASKGLKEAVFYSTEELEASVEPFDLEFLMPTEVSGSERRRRALLRMARSFADLEKSEKVLAHHLEAAKGPAQGHFMEIRKVFA